MSTASTFFGGSGGGIPVQRLFTSSGTFTCPVKGNYLVTAIGGGGASKYNSTCRGSGAGGLAQSIVKFNAGDVLTFTVGAGGTPVVGDTSQAGGNTTVTGSGISLTANGGNGVTFGIGGTASGGNVMNIQGGSSGNANGSGGGAVGVYGFTPGNTSAQAYGYGAGTGLMTNGTGNTSDTWSLPGMDGISSFTYSAYGGSTASNTLLNSRILQPVGTFNGSNQSYSPGRGGVPSAQGGMFAGGGGSSNTPDYAGKGGALGGGAGGCHSTGGYNAPGGVGGVIIEFFIA